MRVVLTVLFLLGWLFFNGWFNPLETLVAGKSAGLQFDTSDISYLENNAIQGVLKSIPGWAGLLFPVLIVLTWAGPFRRSLKAVKDDMNKVGVILAVGFSLAGVALSTQDAKAYYDQQDWTENYFILPNESAFWIPDVGDNKTSQAQFMSEQYLKDNKVAAKRFNIPHIKLPNSGAWSNYYVPSGRLIVLDRSTFAREWVAQEHRGTSKKDESFPCQSSEGLDISVGVAIGASLTEENAPKFLYNFGVLPPTGDRTKPEIIFQSVYRGKSLTEVMDGPVRSKVQALVCDNMTMHTLDENNKMAAQTMVKINSDVKVYLDSVGITLQYIGWADTFTFGKEIQNAINRRYAADKDVAIAQIMAPHVATLQGVAQAQATKSLADKWDGKVPANVSLSWFPSSIVDFVTNMFAGKDKK